MKRTLFAQMLRSPVSSPGWYCPCKIGINLDLITQRTHIEESEYRTNHSMGCMLLQECQEGVVEITSLQDIVDYYGDYPEVPWE